MNSIFCELRWKNTLVRDPADWLRLSVLVLYKRLGSGWTSTNQLGPAPIAMLHILQIKKSLCQKWISRNATCHANVLIRTRHDCTVRALLHIKNQHGTALVAIGTCSVDTMLRTNHDSMIDGTLFFPWPSNFSWFGIKYQDMLQTKIVKVLMIHGNKTERTMILGRMPQLWQVRAKDIEQWYEVDF